MKFNIRTVWLVGDWDHSYWLRQAVYHTYRELSGTDQDYPDLLHFETRELAEEFALAVLRRFHDSGGGSTEVWDEPHLSPADLAAAQGEIHNATDTWVESRFVGEPQIGLGQYRSPTLTHRVELRLGGTVRTTKTATVDGEVFTKTSSEKVFSSWYPGPSVETSLGVRAQTNTAVHADPE
jgi:hypothetical protein